MTWIPFPKSEHFAAAYTPRSTVHAVPFTFKIKPVMRTVCGSDVPLWIWSAQDDQRIVGSWPPPREQRCEDCAAELGTKGKAHEWWTDG